jgi:hypothetical protein
LRVPLIMVPDTYAQFIFNIKNTCA